jgi:hypothetical protein
MTASPEQPLHGPVDPAPDATRTWRRAAVAAVAGAVVATGFAVFAVVGDDEPAPTQQIQMGGGRMTGPMMWGGQQHPRDLCVEAPGWMPGCVDQWDD